MVPIQEHSSIRIYPILTDIWKSSSWDSICIKYTRRLIPFPSSSSYNWCTRVIFKAKCLAYSTQADFQQPPIISIACTYNHQIRSPMITHHLVEAPLPWLRWMKNEKGTRVKSWMPQILWFFKGMSSVKKVVYERLLYEVKLSIYPFYCGE